ncbi:nucleotidyltransferase domain-containing protein [Saccharolobus islandicus]|nr:nucleotidyltransferase domain-containing protein [Sulfolobus islandicus]
MDPNSKAYVFGGVAENRATVLSDIDILIVLK